MAHTPPPPSDHDRIDRLIDGAMQEVAELSWDRTASGAPPHGPAPHAADVFPGYQVLKEIRSGGQGVVYLGIEEATDRRVAIKTFHAPGISTPKDRYRFEREVEALQNLVHPGIVRILHTEAGSARPFIIMEYVPGWNLDEYVREHDLDIRAALRMFQNITLAIHAAHQKGVIHRDIKPSNIRVDHNAEPHVLDFGLAKISTASGPEMTETGQFLGTLHWVSPEQAEGRHQDVDVRTDVYSLGVVLYHVLTGDLPFEQGGSMRDILNRIATAEPIPPSRRRVELDDDLDTIVLKCLMKDPARRYASAADLAADLERWLDARPIEARRASTMYVIGKTLRRHKLAATVSAAFLLLTLGATIVSGVQWRRAEREAARARTERDRTERAVDFLAKILGGTETINNPTERAGLKRMMDDAARALEDGNLAAVPEAELRVRLIVGNAYFFVGEYELARQLFASAEELSRQLHGPNDPSVARAMSFTGEALHWSGRAHEALAKHEGALAVVRSQPSTPSYLTSEVLSKLSVCLIKMGRPEDALPYARESLDVCRRDGFGDHLMTARALTMLGHCQADLDQGSEALATYRELLTMCRKTPIGRASGEDMLGQTLSNVGKALRALDQNENALPELLDGIEHWRKVYPDDHPYFLPSRGLLACCLQSLGRDAEAIQLIEQSLAACRSLNSQPHQSTAGYCALLSQAMVSAGKHAGAEAIAREGVIMARIHPEWGDHIRTCCEWALARALAASGKIDDAVESASQFSRSGNKTKNADASAVWRLAILAEALLQRAKPGDPEASESLLRECIPICRDAISEGRAQRYLSHHVTGLLGQALAAQNKFDEARPILLESRAGFTNAARTKAELHIGVNLQREAAQRLVSFYESWNSVEPSRDLEVEAARWRAELGTP